MAEIQRMKTKVCLVGEAAVGKTSLIRRYVEDQFDDRYITTLGAKVSKRVEAFRPPEVEKPIQIDLTMWDIMGEKAFRELLKEAFFHGAKGILAVADITRYSTLRELEAWVGSVFRVCGEVPVVIAVNKYDLREEATSPFGEREIEPVAGSFHAPFYYTSAKTGENV